MMFNIKIDGVIQDDVVDIVHTRDQWDEPTVLYYFQLDECKSLSDATKCASEYYKTNVVLEPAW